jgi:hypothetical protein
VASYRRQKIDATAKDLAFHSIVFMCLCLNAAAMSSAIRFVDLYVARIDFPSVYANLGGVEMAQINGSALL